MVPVIDVFVEVPAPHPEGRQVIRDRWRSCWEVPGVEYLYSTSSPGQWNGRGARVYVGQDEERALLRLNQKLAANADRVALASALARQGPIHR